MISVFEQTFRQRKTFWLPAFMAAFMALLFAFMAAPKANAAYFRPQMVFTMAAAQAADTDGDGRTDETFSAEYTVYDDGTAEGFAYLDSDYRIEIESGRIEVDENGELIVTVNGQNLEHELGHTLGFRHEHTLPAPTGGGGDIIDFIIVDAATGHTNAFGVAVQISVR